MPEVSSGMYIHDFTVNRTAIIEDSRCFVMVMDRNEIAPPRTFFELIQNIKEDGYELDLDEVQHEMMIVLPELTKDEVIQHYGWIISGFCKGKATYKLEPVPEEVASVQKLDNFLQTGIGLERKTRSTKGHKSFKEVSKFSINYKIINYDIL